MVFVNTSQYCYAVLGGALLGISTSINYILRGKVTGMSGILFGIVSWNKKEIYQKLSIVGGMLTISGIFFDSFQYDTLPIEPFGPQPQITSGLSYYGFIIAGLLTGIGAKLMNGCTSGHGLCGLPRLSMRSIVAVCIFLLTAIGISTLKAYQSLGLMTDTSLNPIVKPINNMITANLFLVVGIFLPIFSYFYTTKGNHKEILLDIIIVYIVGIVFGLGLMISGMTRRAKITAFLSLNSDWDPSLLFVLMTGVLINLITFNYMLKFPRQSLLGHKLFNPQNAKIDRKLIIGSILFGLGWGIGSLCPGPFIMLFSVFTIEIQLLWGGSCILGMLIINWMFREKKIVQSNSKIFLNSSAVVEQQITK